MYKLPLEKSDKKMGQHMRTSKTGKVYSAGSGAKKKKGKKEKILTEMMERIKFLKRQHELDKDNFMYSGWRDIDDEKNIAILEKQYNEVKQGKRKIKDVVFPKPNFQYVEVKKKKMEMGAKYTVQDILKGNDENTDMYRDILNNKPSLKSVIEGIQEGTKGEDQYYIFNIKPGHNVKEVADSIDEAAVDWKDYGIFERDKIKDNKIYFVSRP